MKEYKIYRYMAGILAIIAIVSFTSYTIIGHYGESYDNAINNMRCVALTQHFNRDLPINTSYENLTKFCEKYNMTNELISEENFTSMDRFNRSIYLERIWSNATYPEFQRLLNEADKIEDRHKILLGFYHSDYFKELQSITAVCGILSLVFLITSSFLKVLENGKDVEITRRNKTKQEG